ncbi:ABC transporter substrate-binding protein [Cohnella soli]|uniref:ABC transporter substrate-binding protein n=1 Tax=Cohnella soli TaxID=425005 RepID=A0ABW0HRA5_9BACL
MKKWKVFNSAVIFSLVCMLVIAGCSGKDAATGENAGTTESSKAPATESAATTENSSEAQKGIVLDPNKKVKLRYYTSSGYDQVEFDEAYPEWQKLHPNIEVELVLVSSGDFATSVKMASIAGEQMDVIYTGTDTLERASPDSLYMPLDDLVQRDGWDLKAEFGDYKDQFVVGGKQYGIPRAVAPDGVWYNKKQFEEAGLPDPSSGDWTWEQFFQTAKKLTKYDSKGNIVRYGVQEWKFGTNNLATTAQNIALYSGWEILKEDGSFNPDWTNFKKAVELLYNAVYVDKSMASPAELIAKNLQWQNDFYKGTNAMGIGGRNGAIFQDLAVEYGQLTKEEDDAGIHTLAPMPRWDASSPKKLAFETVVGDSLSKSTKNPEEAYAFIKWHATKSIEIASKVAHRMPASKLLNKEMLLENWRYYNNKDGVLTQGKERNDLYNRMMDPEITPIYYKNSVKYSYASKMKAELEKHLSLLFANEVSLDETIENAKIATFKIYEDETK